MIVAIRVVFLVLDDNEERVWRYCKGPVHDLDKSSHSLRLLQDFYKPCEYYLFDAS